MYKKLKNIFTSKTGRFSGLNGGMLAVFLLACFLPSGAFELPAGSKTDSYVGVQLNDISKENGKLITNLTFDFSKVSMKENAESLYTLMYVNGSDTAKLETLIVAGRNRWFYLQRNEEKLDGLMFKGFGSNKGELFEKHQLIVDALSNASIYNNTGSSTPGITNLTLTTPYQEWMETADFIIDIQQRGCANCPVGEEETMPLAQTDFVKKTFTPEFVYVTPVAEAVKMREISARAYIDFPVNQIVIYPDYRRNPQELAKIRATIDSVKNDKDINITSLHISGTASPEGSYQNNVRLAKGRTEALKNYVQGLYNFPNGFITTSYEPVDWEGLAQFLTIVTDDKAVVAAVNSPDSIRIDQFKNIPGYVAGNASETLSTWKSAVSDAAQILNIVTGDLEPVARNNKIKTTYPKQYSWLLENVYPALRHSDYRIQFEIKTYSEVDEIIEVMTTQPQKLSLSELFVAANSQEPGSELYNRAFELAVVMYPNDETANLNAATAAMQRGDLVSAEKYLGKVKNKTPESEYENAMFIFLKGDTEKALELFRKLSDSSNAAVAAKAKAAVAGIEAVKAQNDKNFTLKQ